MLNEQEKNELRAILKEDGLNENQFEHAVALVDEYLEQHEKIRQGDKEINGPSK